jgi:RNA polymerase sigma factor (sigma-70 family)
MDKKIISNEEYEKAYNLIDNKKIMNAAAKSFRGTLSYNDIESCCYYALWKCLEKYDNSFNAKFTSSLYRFVRWYCIQACQKEQKHINKNILFISEYEKSKTIQTKKDLLTKILCMIPEDDKQILISRFIERKTLKEISQENNCTKQKIRTRLNKILLNIKNGV